MPSASASVAVAPTAAAVAQAEEPNKGILYMFRARQIYCVIDC